MSFNELLREIIGQLKGSNVEKKEKLISWNFLIKSF